MISTLGEYEAWIDEFCESHLREYIDSLDYRVNYSRKEFNDPVWGTIVLHPLEVIVFDSPIVQRLRRIKQLGVAHWVFPSAVHTRLEHTLGVLHQIDAMMRSINERADPHNASVGQIVSADHVRLMRLIALCHDIGHGLMSHVSDNAFSQFDEVNDICLKFADQAGVESVKPSEMASYYMVSSPAFREMITKAVDATGDIPRLKDAPESMKSAIVGYPISTEIPLLHELISGPFDADKLDYMTRDAWMAGVPVVTDIPRLIQKIRAVRVGIDDLPLEIAKSVNSGPPYYSVFGIALSGAAALDELILGRTLLFNKIYRHQKVRAAEAMVASIFERLVDIGAAEALALPLEFYDDEILALGPAQLEHLANPSTEDLETKIGVIADLCKRLRNRNLFVRSFAFSEKMPDSAFRDADIQRAALFKLDDDLANPGSKRALIQELAETVADIARLLGIEGSLGTISIDNISPYLCIDPPQTNAQGKDIQRAYLVTETGELTRFRDESGTNSRGWGDAYLLTRDIGFVFCPREIQLPVHLAAEKIFRERYGLRVPSAMIEYSKVGRSDLANAKNALSEEDYYENVEYDLRPMPSRLEKADIKPRVAKVLSNLSGYQDPFLAEEEVSSQKQMSEQRVVSWLRQFEEDELIESALCSLESMRVIGRSDIGNALKNFLTDQKDFAGANICRLGDQKDSSGLLMYFAEDSKVINGCNVKELEAALSEDKPIIFMDDFIGSGQQVVDILQVWLDEPQTGTLFEERNGSLSPDQQKKFRSTRLAFVYSTGWETGKEKLEGFCHEQNLDAMIYIEIKEAEQPSIFSEDVIADAEARERFTTKCAEIGMDLAKQYSSSNRSASELEQRTLGYGNKGLLICFPYNTPAQTLTCIWADGQHKGVSWTALLPRRKKI